MRHQDFSLLLFMRQQKSPVRCSQSPWVKVVFYGRLGFETAPKPAKKGGGGQDKSKISATEAEYVALL